MSETRDRFDIYLVKSTRLKQIIVQSPRNTAVAFADAFNEECRTASAVIVQHGIVPVVTPLKAFDDDELRE